MYVTGIGTAAPSAAYTQRQCWEAVQLAPQFVALQPRSRALLKRLLLNDNGIRSRRLALESLAEAFDADPESLHARFARHAPQLAAAAAASALRRADLRAADIDALTISTCTGYLCPGLSSYVCERLPLRKDVLALDLVGQGCGAAIPNLRAAEALIRGGGARKVLSICVEVCSAACYIDDDPGVLVSACLFGDGAGAAVLSAEPAAGRRIEWRRAWSMTEPAQRDSLRFEQRGGMLRNVLSLKVPELAARHASQLLRRALAEEGVRQADIATWVWHAGGRDVLERLRAQADLRAKDLERSARVLSDYGNLSSPFVYFVLDCALRERAAAGPWWLSSFGAGFSCHGALLRVSD
jgi:predicted naringenin-chalcone synthase